MGPESLHAKTIAVDQDLSRRSPYCFTTTVSIYVMMQEQS